MLAAAPIIAGGLGLAGQIMAGSKKGQTAGHPGMQQSGYAAMPTFIQDYLRRAHTPLYSMNMPNNLQNMRNYQMQPGQGNSPGQSQALAALQQANPNMPLEYMGQEPMNPAQIRALSEAQQSGMPGSLAGYMQPFEKEREARLRGVNRTYDEYLKKLNDQDALLNSQISPASNMQLRQQQERIAQNRANSIGDVEGLMEREAFDRARQYRNESLEQMLRAGDIQQQFGQQLANNSNGFNLTANQPGYGHALAMNQVASPFFNSGYQTGGTPAQVTNFGRLGGLLMQAPDMANKFQGMWNSNQGQQMQSYPQMQGNNIQGTPWNIQNPYGNQFGRHFGGY